MRTILCYGDSNTYGSNPIDCTRYPRSKRWTGILQECLGRGFHVIEEGLGGRTTVWDDPIEEHKNGKTYLWPCLASHAPIDLVVLMLGTNDLKQRFSVSAQDIAYGAGKLVEIIRKSGAGVDGKSPEVLLVCPPKIEFLNDMFSAMFEGAMEKSRKLDFHFSQVAHLYDCHYLDSSKVVKLQDGDGLHMDEGNHEKLAKAICGLIAR